MMKKTLWGLIIILICAGLAMLFIKPNKYDFKALSENGEVSLNTITANIKRYILVIFTAQMSALLRSLLWAMS